MIVRWGRLRRICGNGGCDTKQFIREQAWSHHCTSSCAIGADDDPMAVLDSKFRVRGVEGLRVVDASVFPGNPGSYPVVPTLIVSVGEWREFGLLIALAGCH
jgi:choline dehydrogenase